MSNPESTKPFVVAERTEPRVYVGRNERGAEVRIGFPGAEGTFSPGELLRLAAAGCAAISADHALASRLGDDFDASFSVRGAKPTDGEDRYEYIDTIMEVDWSELDPEKLEPLLERVHRAIDRYCTVGHTLEHGAESRVTITSK